MATLSTCMKYLKSYLVLIQNSTNVNSHLSDNYNPRHRVGDSLYILSSTCPRRLSSKANIIDEVA